MNISETSGRKAEVAAAAYLTAHGYVLIDTNWRHPAAEIDIVAQKGRTVTCFEVKYRRFSGQGSGYDYITPSKLSQMRKAARLWQAANSWRGLIELGACEVSGPGFVVTGCITEL